MNKEKKQFIIFVGCFNPPHNAHFLLAQQLLNEYKQIEKIIFVPVNSSYQKEGLIGNEHRYQMLKLVCDKNQKFEVSRMEIDSSRALFTIETLEKMQEQYQENELGVVIGSDNLKELSTWKRAQDLVKDFKIYVLERENDKVEEIIEKDNLLKEHKEAFIKNKNSIISNLSSTFIRNSVKQKKSIQYLVPEEVRNYIEEHKLYQ